MFLKVKADSIICFYKTFSDCNIETSSDDIFINLSLINQLLIKKCFIQINVNGKHLEVTRQIEFDSFVDEGILNHFTLFFINEKDKEFKRIKKAVKAFTIKGK